MSQPSGACARHSSASCSKPGIPRAATVPSGPAETRLTRMPLGPEVAGQVARDGLERRLGDAHPVVDRPRDGWRRSRARRRSAPGAISGASAAASAFNENALVWNACMRALGRRGHELAAERVLGRERDRVQHAVDAAPALSQVVGQRVEVRRAVDVELEHVDRLGQARWRRARSSAGRARSSSAPPRRPPAGPARRVEGDRVLGDDAGDQQPLAGEDHGRGLASARSAHASRSRVSTGSTISSTNPAAAAASARRCSSA